MALSPAKFETLKVLVAALPDQAVSQLGRSFAGPGQGEAAAALADLLEAERSSRRATEAVFGPLFPLLGRDPRAGLTLPRDTLRRLWRALEETHPAECGRARVTANRRTLEEPDLAPLDELCALAADDLEQDRAPGLEADAERLAILVRLTPLLRRSLEQVPEWLSRTGGSGSSLARLAYRDAGQIGPAAGPLFLEVLAAHLGDPGRVLRLVSAVMGRPNDRYAAGSELASFGQRALQGVEARLAVVRGFDPLAGPEAGRAAAEAVALAHAELVALDDAFELSKDGPWGSQAATLRRELAGAAEARLKAAEKAVAQALPLQPARGGKAVRGHPRLDGEPDERASARALTLVVFLASLSVAAEAGYASLRARTSEALIAHVHQYIDDLVERIHAHEPDEPIARAYLEVAAELYGWLTDERTAKAVRRRAAAA
jgi:hypothetical protein